MDSGTSPSRGAQREADSTGRPSSAGGGADSIAVLMTAFQAQAYIGAALESLRAQTMPSWRCIVVDDGSTDATADIVRRLAALDERITLVQQPNAGISAARNTALGLLRPTDTLVALLDADDLLLPHAFTRLTAALDGHPEHVGAQALSELIDEEGAPLDPGRWPNFQRQRWHLEGTRYVPLPVGAPTTLESVLHSWRGYPPASLLFRRAAVDAAGPFDTRLQASGDWDFVIRVVRSGDLTFVDETVALYRLHGSNHTRDAARLRTAVTILRPKAIRDLSRSPEHRSMARRAWRAFERGERDKARSVAVSAARNGRPLPVLAGAAAWGLHAARGIRGGPGRFPVVAALLAGTRRAAAASARGRRPT